MGTISGWNRSTTFLSSAQYEPNRTGVARTSTSLVTIFRKMSCMSSLTAQAPGVRIPQLAQPVQGMTSTVRQSTVSTSYPRPVRVCSSTASVAAPCSASTPSAESTSAFLSAGPLTPASSPGGRPGGNRIGRPAREPGFRARRP